MTKLVRLNPEPPKEPSVDDVVLTLHEMIDDYQSGRYTAKKMVVVFLDEEPIEDGDQTIADERTYDVSIRQSGLDMSEIIALFTVAQRNVLDLMCGSTYPYTED